MAMSLASYRRRLRAVRFAALVAAVGYAYGQQAAANDYIVLDGHDGLVSCMSFSPSGALLASGGHDGTVRVWSATDGSALKSIALQDKVERVVFLNEQCIVAVTRATVVEKGTRDPGDRLFLCATKDEPEVAISEVETGHPGSVRIHDAITLPLSDSVVVGVSAIDDDRQAQVVVCDGSTGRILTELFSGATAEVAWDQRGALRFCVSPDQSRLYVAGVAARQRGGSAIVSWGTDGWTELSRFNVDGRCGPLLVSGDNGLLAGVFHRAENKGTSVDGIQLWNISDGRLIGRFPFTLGRIHSLSFSRDSQRLVAPCIRIGNHPSHFWAGIIAWTRRTSLCRPLVPAELPLGVRTGTGGNNAVCASFSPTEMKLAIGMSSPPRLAVRNLDYDETYRIGDFDLGPRAIGWGVSSIQFSPTGDTIAVMLREMGNTGQVAVERRGMPFLTLWPQQPKSP